MGKVRWPWKAKRAEVYGRAEEEGWRVTLEKVKERVSSIAEWYPFLFDNYRTLRRLIKKAKRFKKVFYSKSGLLEVECRIKKGLLPLSIKFH